MRGTMKRASAGAVFAVAAVGTFSWIAAGRLVRRHKPDAYSHPGRYDLPFEQVAFSSRDGVTLRGWFVPNDNAKGTIVFCPGHGGSVHADLTYAPWLHTAGYSLLLFDWRGRGRSDGAVTSMGILERRDLLGAIDFLKGRNIDRVGLLGFSMGGAVAMTTSPISDAVAAVVSDSGFSHVQEVIVNGMIHRGYPRLVARVLSRPLVLAMSLRLGVDVTIIDPLRWAGFFRAPLLMIHGQRDPFVTPDAVYRLYHTAREPKNLWLVPEAGHRDIYQLRPQEYRERVIGFFDRWLL